MGQVCHASSPSLQDPVATFEKAGCLSWYLTCLALPRQPPGLQSLSETTHCAPHPLLQVQLERSVGCLCLIRRWWQLGRWQQLQPWCFGDMKQGKGLPLFCHLAFLNHLWKQKSEEEEEEEKEEDEEESSLDLLKPNSSSKDVPIGKQGTTISPQLTYGSEGLPKATETPEQIILQSSSPFRSYPTIQILTNLPARSKITSGSYLQQKRSQLFWGFPSLHSESLETIFLSSDGPSPLKLSICPSVFFNKLAFLPKYNLLLPHCHSPAQVPTCEAHTREDLEEMAQNPQLVSSPSSPSTPTLSLHNFKPLPMDPKRVLSGAKADIHWLSQQEEVSWVSEDQALHLEPKLQRIIPSKLLSSPEACWNMPWDPSLHQNNPGSSSASLLYPSISQGIQDRVEASWRTMGQNEHLKISEPAILAPSPTPASLPKFQRVNPKESMSGSKAMEETTEQKENPPISETPILAPCQPIAAMTEPQGTSPPVYKAQLGSIGPTSEIPPASKPLKTTFCQPASLSESPKVNPRGKCSAPDDFRETMEYRNRPEVSMFPMPAPSPPLDSLLELQERILLEDPSGDNPQWERKENSGNPWAFEPQALDLNTNGYETSLAYVPSESETSQKGTESRENVWVSVEAVSSTNLPLDSLLRVGSQKDLSKFKALWEIKEQTENFWESDFTDSTQSTPLTPFIEAKLKGNRYSKKSWASEPPSWALSLPYALALESLRISPTVVLFDSNANYRDIQTRSWASDLPACSLSQELYGAKPLRAGSDSEPVGRYMEQLENCHVPMSPNQPSNSISKSHISESFGDQCNDKPEGDAVEQAKNCWATEQQAPSSLSTAPLNLHTDLEFVCRNVQEKEVPQGPSLPLLNTLCPISWPPTLTKAPKIEPTEPDIGKGKMFSETKAKALSSQGEAVLEVLTHPGTHVWQWSRELEFRLKRLHQSPFKSSSLSQPLCSSPALSATTPDSSEPSSCPPQQIRHLKLHYSSCHPPKIQDTVFQPIEVPQGHHSHSSQLQAPDRAKQESQKKERIKVKLVTQVPSQKPNVHIEADENHPGRREFSKTGGLASGKKQNKVSLTQKFLRKHKAGECAGGKARRGSCKVIGKSYPFQAWRVAEAPANRSSPRSQHRDQSSPHTTLPQQLLPKVANPQDKWKVGLVTGGIQNPHHCKHCRWAHTEKHLPSSITQAPHTRSFQSMLAKFLGIRELHSPTNPVSRKKSGSSGT
ncbi:spermatogenesis-associated protein 31G1 [Thomomys bottae]